MIKNYLKIAWRNLIRNKVFSVINIMGLGLGIACSLLIMLWVQDERSVDGFHVNGKQLYQVYERNFFDGKVDASYSTQGLLADELKRVIPEVQYSSGFEHASAPGTQSTFEANNTINKLDGAFAGTDFFSMFSYSLVQGAELTALNTHEAIAISRKMAELFFGSAAEAMGKTIRYENKEDLLITAVFENPPANSSLLFDFLRSWVAFVKENGWVHNWGNTSPNTFVQLRKDTDPVKVEAKIKDFIYMYQQKNEGSRTELALQPYPERYLHSTFKNGQVDGGRIEYVHMFTLIAVFILLIACINFMNLATARAANRAKEVGIRKMIGALRSSLIGQFVSEAMLLTVIAAVIAVALLLLLLPGFNALTGKQLSLPVNEPSSWMYFFGLLAITGLTAGSYPAFFLSSLKPVRVVKGTLAFGRAATLFRKGLVVFQFTLSIILIVGMAIIYRQMDYIQSKNLGYDRENLVYIPIEGDLVKKYNVLKEEAAKIPGIVSISKMRNSPTIIEHHTGSIAWPGKDPNLMVSFADGVVGYDFVKTMKLQLNEGRDFSKDFNDTASYLLNETAVNRIGYKNPVGQEVIWGNRPGKIIGVLKDFHFSSMHQSIDPLIIRLDENWNWGTILVRITAGNTKESIAGLEKICHSLNPKFPFTYQFSDQAYTWLYKSEQLVSQLANGFAMLAIFISCLGLFGLATFMAGQRKKEIAVRKVLGAGVAGIASMLSADFVKLVLLSILIATPVAWGAMNKWLQDFAYRINIQWWVFAVAGLLAVLIAILTVSFHAVKAAVANPVNSLRSE